MRRATRYRQRCRRLRKQTRKHKGGQQDRETPLTRAIKQLNTELAQQLIQMNENDLINTKNGHGQTPLYIATENNDLTIVDSLLTAGANPNILSLRWDSNVTALENAANLGYAEIVARLLQTPGIDVNAGGPSPLLSAVLEGHVGIVQQLIAAGADVNDPAMKPLYFATQRSYPDIVRILIQAGANPNIKVLGHTPLHIAVGLGDFEIVQALVEGGADRTIRNSFGLTALQTAQALGIPQIVQLLQEVPAITPVQTPLNIPRNSNPENSVQYIPIQEGNELVDFHGESGFGRYYKRNTYNALPPPKRNPATRRPIAPGNVTYHTAHLV